MANEEHLSILKQGVAIWNIWRKENPSAVPDLSEVNLSKARSLPIVGGTDLLGANLRGANLEDANLRGATLYQADLRGASMKGADLTGSTLLRANLLGANLGGAILNEATLDDADFGDAICGYTVFACVDLSNVNGLDKVKHFGPSTIGIDTLLMSGGKIPGIFLRGCGVPEVFISYLLSLTGNAIEFYSCFISYSHADKDFARLLHNRLQGEGIRCWLDEHDLNPGDPLHPTIYEAISTYDKIILCCSKTSLTSWWVEKEFSRAIKKEEDYKLPLIIPLNVDEYLFSPECTGWVADELKQRLAEDLTGWKDHDKFEAAMTRVIKALRTDGGKLAPPTSKLMPPV